MSNVVRTTIRKWVPLLVSVIALMAASVACSGDGDATSSATSADGQPKYGGTLTVTMYTGGSTSFDPPMLLGDITLAATRQFYNTLVSVGHDLSVKPELATSWEPNADLTSYTFNLRQDVTFRNGKEMKAEDVLFSVNRLLDEEIDSPARSTFTVIKNMVALNDYTVRFDLNKANALFPEIFSMYQAKIYPSNIDVARLELEEFGSGPFMLEEYLPNERIVLTRNPDYWDEGKPYLDKIVMLVIQEPATRAEALKNGDVDMIWMLQHQSAASLEAHSDTSVQEIPSASYLNLAMDVRTEPFDNVLVRRAFQAATDRQAILQAALAGKGGIASDHPIPSSDPNFNSECAPPAYDPELAKSLLAEAGYPDGIDQILYTSTAGPGMVEMAVAYKERAAAAGIRIDVQQMPEDAYWAKIWMVEPFVTVYWFGRNPDQALSIVYLSDGSWNESYYNNPTVDELILKARGQADDLGRAKTYGEVQCLLIDEVPRIIPVFQPMLNGVRNDVKGVQVHPRGYLVLVDAWLDR